MMGIRTPMIRYTQPLNNSNSVGLSVEKSGTDAPFATQLGSPVTSSTRPDLIACYRYENQRGHLYFAGISRSLGGVIPNSTIPDLKNHVDGYGGSLAGVWQLGGSKDNVIFDVNLIFQPSVSLLFGAEYIYGQLVRKNNYVWNAPRIQGSAQYSFNKYPKE